ncbi:MAG: protein translocase subunit SecF [Candidatus Shapirobacteria bacterium]|jgi:preprotein translocase subunit SecF
MNFMKFRPLFFLISLVLLSMSVYSIMFWKFKPSVDFSGGSVWELNLPSQPDRPKIDQVFTSQNIKLSSFSQNQTVYLLKFENITSDQKVSLQQQLQKLDPDLKEQRFETLGPLLGRELLKKTIYAIVLASLFLLVFIGTRFHDFTFGLSAILAMLHDALILVGSFSILGRFFNAEVDSLFVTALLTTLSASVHDTVVTFDRIRELKRQLSKLNWVELANAAITETIVRSLNNSMTIIFMLTSLVVLGGATTRWFAVALLIGVICGTYSSFAVAIPLVLFWKRKK